MKNTAILAVAALLVTLSSAPGTVSGAFSFNGVDGAPAPGEFILIKLQDFEVVLDKTTAPAGDPTGAQVLASKQAGGLVNDVGDQLYGTFKITSINDITGTKTYWTPSANQELAGYFYGYTATSVGAGSPVVDDFSGGTINLFFDSSPDFSASTGPFTPGWVDIATSNGVGNAGDSLFLSATGVNGITASPTTTLQSTFSALTLVPLRFTGVGDGFLTVTASSLLQFGGDAMDPAGVGNTPGSQDLKFKSNFDNNTAAGTNAETTLGWSIVSQDPISGKFVQVVPEPTSMLVWAGMSLAGACAAYRRRRKVAG